MSGPKNGEHYTHLKTVLRAILTHGPATCAEAAQVSVVRFYFAPFLSFALAFFRLSEAWQGIRLFFFSFLQGYIEAYSEEPRQP